MSVDWSNTKHNRSIDRKLDFGVKTINAIAPEGLAKLPADYNFGPDIETPHAILLRSHKLKNEEVPNSVRAIARCGAGTNNIPVPDMTERGIPVFNTPGANANAVKELVVCALFLSSRGIYNGIRHVEKMWEEESDSKVVAARVEKEKKFFRGQEIQGKMLGVVGLGHIGRSVAQSASDLGMKVTGYDPAVTVETAWQLPQSVIKAEKLNDLLSTCDYISLHAPYIKDVTHHMIGAEQIACLKPTANLLNFARDELVDVAALKAAYDNGTFEGNYISDFAIPTLHNQGYPVHMIPHLGASTEEAESNSAAMAAKQVTDFLEQGIVRNSVNFPECLPPPLYATEGPTTRMIVVNTNEKGVLAEITTALGEFNCNIVQHLNTSRADIAYNVIDMTDFPENAKELQSKLGEIHGVRSSRILAGDPGTFFYYSKGDARGFH
jgi:D-3-phosphoglycerate dehydrogenase